MKILVTGGSGFVGSRLIPKLLGQGHSVTCYDIRVNQAFADFTVNADVRDRVALHEASRGVDAIIHLAAAHRDDVKPVSLYQSVNVGGAQNVVQAAADNGVSTIIFTSTVALYGLDKENSRETDTPDPFNEYGRSKWEAEEVFRAWHTQGKTLSEGDATKESARKLLIVRPCVIFGEGNRGNVYTLAKQLSSGMFMTVGDGQNHKSMAYVGNVVEFLAQRLVDVQGYELYNYADKPDLSTQELVSILRKALNKHTGQSLHIPLELGMLGGKVFDVLAAIIRKPLPISSVRIKKFAASTVVNADALEALGFQRPYTLAEGLQRTINAEFGKGRGVPMLSASGGGSQ
ncbi:MAG: NAD-dependent epimerase/dehydratase family protein [Actinomycetaceae bacterium]|nr:NAD-dependent epimerase/dehydratase family protein [Actinomycetaceae bacterium]